MRHDERGGRDRIACLCAIGTMLALAAAPALAAGGADVVDDAFVETPGVCHVESWRVEAEKAGSLVHFGFGCTPSLLPRLEVDGAVERQDEKGPSRWAFSPTLKYTVFARPSAVALGISTSAIIDRSGRMTSMSVDLPLSISRGKYTMINLDIGWQATRDAGVPVRNQASWGAQIVQAVAPHVGLVGEVFGLVGDRPGEQGGVRWSPGSERIDIDLRGSHGPDGAGNAVTLGFTLRL